MYVHQDTVATTYAPSADGQRINARSTFMSAAATRAPVPEYQGEDIDMAEALKREEFSYLGADDSWNEEIDGRVPLDNEEGGVDNDAVDDGITLRLRDLGGDEKHVHFQQWVNAVSRIPFYSCEIEN